MFRFGYCGWLLAGKRLPDMIQFLANEGFNSVSWLQSIMNYEESERKEAAAAIKELNFTLCWHGNVQANLTKDFHINEEFTRKMLQDVLWWHENTNGVVSCCSDAISAVTPDHPNGVYLKEDTWKLLQMESEFFENSGTSIGYGIENSCLRQDKTGYARIKDMQEFKNQLSCPEHVGMIFDVGHANLYLNRTPEDNLNLVEYMKQLPFKIYEIHVTDNHGQKDEHLIPGEGNIDYTQMYEGVQAIGFDGVISLEVCKDILKGYYSFDLNNSKEQDMIRLARDRFLNAFHA